MSGPAREDPVAQLEAALRREQKKMSLVQDVGRALSSALELDQLLVVIMEKVTALMEADRSTLYLLSETGDELWSKVAQGGEVVEIRLRVGEGIAGWVASSGKVVNIPDAYVDQRFQPAVDLRSGYRTRSILCAPMRDSQGAMVGVVQVLNKAGGPFTDDDEDLLEALGSQAAIAIENATLYHSLLAQNRLLERARDELERRSFEVNALFEVEQELSANLDLDALLGRILDRTLDTLGAESGTIALREPDGERLRFHTVRGPAAAKVEQLVLPVGEGVIGWVVARGQAVIVDDPADDDRHAAALARRLGVRPRNLMCAPLVDGDAVIGALEVVDAVTPPGDAGPARFGDGDLKLLVLIAGQLAKAIGRWRSRSEQERKDRLASIGQMLAGVLHDLKTPMTIISGYAQLMASTDEAPQREAYVDQILHQFDVMSAMAREVLAFARGDVDLVVRRVYLHLFLDEVATQLRAALAGRRIELEVAGERDGIAFFDEHKMLRVIHNLARNAAEAMPDGGRFRLALSLEEQHVVIEAADTGGGIPPEIQQRLFTLFASGKRGGTGLGLAIVKKIVGDHGGSIDWDTGAGGTTFRIRLPRTRASMEIRASTARPADDEA